MQPSRARRKPAGSGERALRHAAAGLAVVAAHPDSDHAAAVYSVIRMLGPTLRYEVLGWHHAERVHASGKRCIWAFWHRIIIPIVWCTETTAWW